MLGPKVEGKIRVLSDGNKYQPSVVLDSKLQVPQTLAVPHLMGVALH